MSNLNNANNPNDDNITIESAHKIIFFFSNLSTIDPITIPNKILGRNIEIDSKLNVNGLGFF